MADVNVQRGDAGTPERRPASRKAPASGRRFLGGAACEAKVRTLLRVRSGGVEASNVLPVRSLPHPASTLQGNASTRLPLSKAALSRGFRFGILKMDFFC